MGCFYLYQWLLPEPPSEINYSFHAFFLCNDLLETGGYFKIIFMKKIIALILLVGTCYSLFAQTKKETEDWIKEKITTYGGGDNPNRYFVNYLHYKAAQDSMHTMQILDGYMTTPFCYFIRINKISRIVFMDKGENYWMYIYTEGNNAMSCMIEKGRKELIDEQWKNHAIVILNKNFKENNLPERMKKAFKRLVELYGGQIKEEVF